MHQDLIARRWATEANFGQALAIGQISPGPNGLWVVSLGYLTNGFVGAVLALVAITIPPLLVLVISARYAQLENSRLVIGAMTGISLAVIGITLTVVWTILHQSGVDGRGVVIAAVAFLFALSRKVNVLLIIVCAGLVGYLVYR